MRKKKRVDNLVVFSVVVLILFIIGSFYIYYNQIIESEKVSSESLGEKKSLEGESLGSRIKDLFNRLIDAGDNSGDIKNVALSPAVVTSVSGTVSHGQNIIISGSNFGTKTTAAPVVWDDASGADISSKWDGFLPNCGSDPSLTIQYRNAPFQGVAAPHNRTGRYLVGSHKGVDANCGYSVMVWKTRNINFPNFIYASFYQRVNPQWNFCSTGASCGSFGDNFKSYDYSTGSGPYGAGYCYLNYDTNSFDSTSSLPSWSTNDDGCGWGGTVWYGNNGANPAAGWVKIEVEIKYSKTNDGYVKLWDNGAVGLSRTGEITDGLSGTLRTESLGGYASANDPNN